MCQRGDGKAVDVVVKMGLCTGCGACVSMCPSKAITMNINKELGIFLPEIDSSKCNSCSVCYKVCPGIGVNFNNLSRKESPQQTAKPNSDLLGNYVNCYVGYSTDYDIRFNSSSGGIVTQLLVFALEEGLIDGALVTRMSKDRPLEPEPFIARTAEEVVEASKSNYCPVPANVAFREILEHDGKYAVVGLPCHIHGLRKAQALNKKLRERVVLSVGLFCSHNDSFYSTKYLLTRRLGVNLVDVAGISYRGKGWPGMLTVKQKSGKVISCPMRTWIPLHDHCFFAPYRCLVCCDHTAELADVSAGDAWLQEFSDDHIGRSIFISRNKIGEKMLQLASSAGLISMNRIDPIKVVRSQGNLRFKKNGYIVRSFLFKKQGKNIPTYNVALPQPALIDWARSCQILINRRLMTKRLFQNNLERLISLQSKLKKVYMKAISH